MKMHTVYFFDVVIHVQCCKKVFISFEIYADSVLFLYTYMSGNIFVDEDNLCK